MLSLTLSQLYIVDAKWSSHGYDIPRGLAILNSIQRSIVAFPGAIPNIEFSFCLGDIATFDPSEKHATWALTRRAVEEEKWVMPDFGYWSWPLDVVGEYTQVRDEIVDLEETLPFKDKKPQAVWRGAVGTNPLREELINATRGKSWSDVQEIVWLNMTIMAPGSAELSLTMPEHCKYQYVIHTEGHSYSGRGKYLQNCESVVVMHKLEWIEPHSHLLDPKGPKQNIVQVERDFSDLEDKIEDLLAHPADAQRIAENGVKMFRERYLTPAAQACYWRRLFWGWKEVQGFEPELWEEIEEVERSPPEGEAAKEELGEDELKKEKEDKKTRKVKIVKRMRGKPYETFILEGFKPNPT
jgi:Glycosyl transferase family 90